MTKLLPCAVVHLRLTLLERELHPTFILQEDLDSSMEQLLMLPL